MWTAGPFCHTFFLWILSSGGEYGYRTWHEWKMKTWPRKYLYKTQNMGRGWRRNLGNEGMMETWPRKKEEDGYMIKDMRGKDLGPRKWCRMETGPWKIWEKRNMTQPKRGGWRYDPGNYWIMNTWPRSLMVTWSPPCSPWLWPPCGRGTRLARGNLDKK